MGKRISRKELKQWNRELKHKVKELEYDLDDVRLERNNLDHRLTLLGSRVETLGARGSGIECIDIEPEPWGQYCVLRDNEEPQMDEIKRRLVGRIAEGLMKSNNIQIIVHDDIFPGRVTIGAKLYVIPWDQMAKRIAVKI